MTEPAAVFASPPAAPAAPATPAVRHLSDEVDLYAEANSFSEADWAGPPLTDLFGEDGLTFGDMLDIVNPLHHLPGVGTVYRAVTGDELSPASRVAGGTLFGGIAGFLTSIANAVIENETGSDIGDTVLAFLGGDDDPVAVAAAEPAAPDAATPIALPAAAAPARKPVPTPQPAFPVAAAPPGGAPGTPLTGLFRSPAPAATTPIAQADQLPPAPVSPPSDPPAAAPAPAPDSAAHVPLMMRQALDKYETLMRDRAGPSVSSEI